MQSIPWGLMKLVMQQTRVASNADKSDRTPKMKFTV